ncbi:hypothetical protein cypCar_00045787 [Cyprinus carpio]|nr:hypothetical protein cypCar_00045787 [Cyprinus carpio]
MQPHLLCIEFDQVLTCGLWNVGPLLFNGCAKLLVIGRNWNTVSYTPIQSIPNMLNGLCGCGLTAQSCESLSSALQSSNSVLRELDLSNNDLKDTGVKLLSDGLMSTNCQLEILRLSGCMVTEKGCRYVSLALSSNPSHLRELDLSYNHPGDSGVKLLSEKLEDSKCSLNKLKNCGLHSREWHTDCDGNGWENMERNQRIFSRGGTDRFELGVDHGEECRITAGLKKCTGLFFHIGSRHSKHSSHSV